jgi:hypothetical protein
MRAGRMARRIHGVARGRLVEGALLRRETRTSARGHFTEMPTRSLRARGAGAPGDNYRMAEVGGSRCITRFAPDSGGRSCARRPLSVAATAGVAMGMRGGRRIHDRRGAGRWVA